MYCLKCGTPLPPDSFFCTNCGAKVDNEYAPNIGPIVPPPMNQPYGDGQQPPQKKKSKALLWVLIGVGAALIVAAALLFLKPLGIGGPFSGSTVQTRFANDAVGVFIGAFSGLSDENVMTQIADKPFDLEMNYSTEVTGLKTDMTINAAYDEKALGVNVHTLLDATNSGFSEFFTDTGSMESTMKMLLLEDSLYTDQDGVVNGLKFDTDADLSQPMPLRKRIFALLNNENENTLAYFKLTEAFLNSIDLKCFDKNARKTTLTLDTDDMVQSLNKLADEIEKNDELRNAFQSLTEDLNGEASDLSELISEVEKSDFEMIWAVNYDGGKPVGIEIGFDESGSSVFKAVFCYETEDKGESINLEITDSSGQTLAVDLLLTKTENGIKYDGQLAVPGFLDKVSISGTQEIDDNHISGSCEMIVLGMSANVNYEGTVSIGMPKNAIEDDSRFAVDTDNAIISDFKDGLGEGLDFSDMPSLGDRKLN